jgi:predicted transcriptional regulator
LANALHRDIRAVNRDLRKLEEAGLVRTSLRVNPGHGRSKFVEPVARSYSLNASL